MTCIRGRSIDSICAPFILNLNVISFKGVNRKKFSQLNIFSTILCIFLICFLLRQNVQNQGAKSGLCSSSEYCTLLLYMCWDKMPPNFRNPFTFWQPTIPWRLKQTWVSSSCVVYLVCKTSWLYNCFIREAVDRFTAKKAQRGIQCYKSLGKWQPIGYNSAEPSQTGSTRLQNIWYQLLGWVAYPI